MSFKSREKKRRATLAMSRSRAAHEQTMAERHYLTIVSRACCCNACGGFLRNGAECVYRHTPRAILCKPCADAQGLRYRPSIRWERQQRKKGQAT
jgi:hypothetical protein